MNTSKQIAKHLREIHFGGNWTCVNIKNTLSGLIWQEATTKIYGCNTIAVLTHHVNYYVDAVLKPAWYYRTHALSPGTDGNSEKNNSTE